MRASIRRTFAMFGLEWRLLRRDPAPIVIIVLMPILLMAFLQPMFHLVSNPGGGPYGATGAEQAVPGMTVMFAFFLVSHIGTSFFREHTWATWDRLRVSALRTNELMAGKLLAPLLLCALVLACLLAAGPMLFHMHISGSLPALALIVVALAACLVALALALVACCHTIMRFAAIANLGALLCGCLGGAVVPYHLLPGWAQALAPASPCYWAMRGFSSVIVHSGGMQQAITPVAVLLTFSAAFLGVAALRFRVPQHKTGWA